MEKNYIKRISLKLSQSMEDIGVSEELLKLRRHVCHLDEIVTTNFNPSSSTRSYIVGSQIEGSTTVGMHSDFDHLRHGIMLRSCLNNAHNDPSFSNYVLVKDFPTMSFPQCCSLQSSLILPNNDDLTSFEVIDRKGRSWLPSSCLIQKDILRQCDLEQHGPAFTYMDKHHEYVPAIYCIDPPADCLVIFQRQKPGHWPYEETLTKAKQFGIFLMNPGTLAHTFDFDSKNHTVNFRVQHPHDYASVQWRMSTNLTERLLMFDLNLVQMKTYTLTKMIKKELLYPLVGDNLSSFHMKTAMFFTVEQFPERIWKDDNLVQCVLYCLNTLKRFVKRRQCPHYTVANVNLFYGKLQIHQFQILNNTLKELIESKLSCILALQMDCIGERLSGIRTSQNAELSTGAANRLALIKKLFFDTILSDFHLLGCCRHEEEMDLVESQIKFEYLISNEHRHELVYFLQNISSTRASIAASACIKNKTPITEEIKKMYEYSMCSDNITNRLKYASMLVCTTQFEQAEAELDAIEKLITLDMVPFFSARQHQNQQPEILTKTTCVPSEIVMDYLRKLLFSVQFLKEELHCLPSHLVFEMYRIITEEDKSDMIFLPDFLFDAAKIDALPFFLFPSVPFDQE